MGKRIALLASFCRLTTPTREVLHPTYHTEQEATAKPGYIRPSGGLRLR
jgi:hypothetical protein